MKSITIIHITLVTTVYMTLVNSQNIVDSPIVNEVETKKALFYNRKPEGGDKIKVVFLRVPDDDHGSKRTRRHSPAYWRSYGQPPLNPTGPPPGLFSPGTPYNLRPSAPMKRRRYIKSKPKYRPKPLRPVQPKTPCPYKQIAEELAAEAEQQRHYHEYSPPQASHPPPPTPPPTTTTTTTTTPAPSTPAPPPVYIQSPQSPQILYQNVDPLMSMQQQQQQQYYQYETLPQDYLQQSVQTDSSTGPQFLVDQNGMILQQQPPPIQNSQQIQTIALSSPQQQFIYKSDMSSPGGGGISTPLLQISQQPQQNLFSDQLQALSRFPGGVGNQLILDRQPQSLQQQISLATGRSATSYPQQLQQQQQQQLILLDNSQLNSQLPQTQTLILPNGQVVQTQQQPQPQQSLVLLNPQHQSGPLSLLQQQGARLNRPSPLGLGHPGLPLFSELGGYISEQQPLIIGGGGDLIRQRNRVKAAPHLPLLLPPPEEDDEEEEPIQPLVFRPRKKPRRPQNTREKEKKRFVIIPRKELEQMKQNKKLAQYSKNLPPPPEVIHIPFHETREEDEEDEEYEEENQGSESSFDFNAPLSFQGSQHQPLKVEESIAHSGSESSDVTPVAGGNESENSSAKAEDKK